MAEDKITWILTSIDPVIISHSTGKDEIYTSKDINPHLYKSWSKIIEKHNLQIGDDMKVCLHNAIYKIYPIRPEQTEEQKQTKQRGMFST